MYYYRDKLLLISKMSKQAVEVLVKFVVDNISHESVFNSHTSETCTPYSNYFSQTDTNIKQK